MVPRSGNNNFWIGNACTNATLRSNRAMKIRYYRMIILGLAFILFADAQLLFAADQSARSALQKAIVDYRHHLSPGFKKQVRNTTKYILVHTSDGIKKAAEIIMEDPLGVPLIVSWDRVTAAIPDILLKIREAVEEENTAIT